MIIKIASYKYIVTLWVLAFVVNACTEDNTEPDNGTTGDHIITAIGQPTGDKTTKIIGSSGGSLESADGMISLTIPEGALSADKEISIQPISNEAPLGLGKGYRLEPEGTIFSKPVELTIQYNEAMLAGTPGDFLWIVTQAANGSWSAALKSSVDKGSETVAVNIMHFSDWALGKFIDLSLTPSSKTLKKNESVALKIMGFSRDKETSEDDELVPLIPLNGDGDELVPLTPIPPVESHLMDFRVKGWTLNGATAPVSNSNGKLSVSGMTATYTAPNKIPSVNPVAVTVELEANNKEGVKTAFYLTSNISVLGSDLYLRVVFNGQTYEYYEYGFNGNIPSDPDNYLVVNCGLTDDGSLGIAASKIINGSTPVNGFGLSFANPAATSRRLTGINEDGQDDMTFQIFPTENYMLDYTEYTKGANDICNYENKCSDVTVTITDYDPENQIIRGYFSGELYEETTSEHGENCKTPDKHSISGEFNLYVANQ